MLDKTAKGVILIVMGDLNARVGRNGQVWDSILDSHGEATKNDSGERLMQFCAMNELLVTNTLYQHKDIHKYTWECPGRQLKSLIEYILVRKDVRSLVHDVKQ